MILTDEEREALGHRIAWRYKKSSDPHHSGTYTFNRATLLQFSEAIEREVLRKLREREPSGYLIDWPDEPDLGDYFSTEPSGCGRSRPLYIIPEVNE